MKLIIIIVVQYGINIGLIVGIETIVPSWMAEHWFIVIIVDDDDIVCLGRYKIVSISISVFFLCFMLLFRMLLMLMLMMMRATTVIIIILLCSFYSDSISVSFSGSFCR